MFIVCRLFISNYFHQCWNWKPRVLKTSILWLVKACLILIFCKFSLLYRFSDTRQCNVVVRALWKWPFFTFPLTCFGEASRTWLPSRSTPSVRYGWGWLKGQKPGDAETWTGTGYSASAWKRQKCVACLCKKEKKKIIKPSSPISASLSSKSVTTKALLPMRFLIIRFLSLEGITFPQSTGWNPMHKLWDPDEGSRCF